MFKNEVVSPIAAGVATLLLAGGVHFLFTKVFRSKPSMPAPSQAQSKPAPSIPAPSQAQSKPAPSIPAPSQAQSKPIAIEPADSHRDCRLKTNNVLVVLSRVEGKVMEELVCNFFGTVVYDVSSAPSFSNQTVYLCGDLAKAVGGKLEGAARVFVISKLAHGHSEGTPWTQVDIGRVPILVHGVGVYYRRFFENVDHFNLIRGEHAFQSLTESTKPGTALRTGIYLTPVEQEGEDLHFRLLRCSTNLSGPTANFGPHDKKILASLNQEAGCIFDNNAPLNHVLAQIYQNTAATSGQKQTKAKIKAHADKTKDMPRNGLMAFCTFYDQLEKLQPLAKDAFDYGHRNVSGLTKLHFRLKDSVAELPGCTFKPQFSVTLYPNSAFFMPLSTNRLYTHEIRPSGLDAAMLPTRMGYVVRCSEAEALFRDGQTFLKAQDKLIPLQPSTAEGMAELRKKYAEENFSHGVIQYEPTLFSMNKGDYAKPMLHPTEFRTLQLSTEGNWFRELNASVRWEDVGKGRRGSVLVKQDPSRGTPIVRTTTQYSAAAHCFQPVHESLANQIQGLAAAPHAFNNALIENYTNEYATMGLHSDQAQDLEEGSSIAVFSCYKHPELASPPRKLVIESKEPGGGTLELPLAHNSVVTWSLDTNRRFRHKIVLDTGACPPPNEWLGITFRTSKTFVQAREDGAVFEDGTPLTIADEAQRREFYKLRGAENKQIEFSYPPLTYTISASDLMPPARPSSSQAS